MAHEQKVIDIYRRHARAWTKARGQNFAERAWIDKFLAILPKAPSVLDIGCGSGEPIGRYLMEKGGAVTGVDASPELIQIAKRHIKEATWMTSDMRTLQIDSRFDGIIAWNSTFHLTPEDQRRMFPVFKQHAAEGAALMFTSGPKHGVAMGEFEGEPLYHSSLSEAAYRDLLHDHAFEIVDHIVEDPHCGRQTVWLARFCGKV